MTMPELDIRLLYIFMAIYQHQSVSRAAQVMNIAQSAASIGLNKLRKHFDDPLFIRVGHTMQATDIAEALYPQMVKTVQSFQSLQNFQVSFDPKHSTREFTIAMTDIGHVALMPKLMAYLQVHAPQVRLNIRPINAQLKKNMADGEIDLVIGFLPQLEAGFYQQTLFTQHYVGLSASTHPRMGHKHKVAVHDYCQERHIDVHPFDEEGNLLIAQLKRLQISRDVLIKVPNYLGVDILLQSSEWIATVPQILADFLEKKSGLHRFDLPFANEDYAIKLHWHEKLHKNKDHQWLRQVCFELFNVNNIDQ